MKSIGESLNALKSDGSESNDPMVNTAIKDSTGLEVGNEKINVLSVRDWIAIGLSDRVKLLVSGSVFRDQMIWIVGRAKPSR